MVRPPRGQGDALSQDPGKLLQNHAKAWPKRDFLVPSQPHRLPLLYPRRPQPPPEFCRFFVQSAHKTGGGTQNPCDKPAACGFRQKQRATDLRCTRGSGAGRGLCPDGRGLGQAGRGWPRGGHWPALASGRTAICRPAGHGQRGGGHGPASRAWPPCPGRVSPPYLAIFTRFCPPSMVV